MSASVCRSCHATIRWVKLGSSRSIPVEPHPSSTGSVAGMSIGNHLSGYVITAARPLEAGYQRYVTHFAACQPEKTPTVPKPRPPSLFDSGAA